MVVGINGILWLLKKIYIIPVPVALPAGKGFFLSPASPKFFRLFLELLTIFLESIDYCLDIIDLRRVGYQATFSLYPGSIQLAHNINEE